MRRNYTDDNVGKFGGASALLAGEPKKRGRKPKKQNEKEITHEYHQEIEMEQEKSAIKQRKLYENMQYLSSNEKANFEDKFTKPKNESQQHYVNLLNRKNKKRTIEIRI